MKLVKSGARVLDATAGMRHVWRKKESRHVLWIDVEPELYVPPDMVLDCTATGFESGRFHTIFFDPPHWWGDRPGKSIYTLKTMEEAKVLRGKYRMQWHMPTYYGTDKFRTKTELLSFIHNAQKEFSRILMEDGVLWLNWSEVKIPLEHILPFFKNWDEMIRLTIRSKWQTLSKAQNYWVMFMKKDGVRQTELIQGER